MANIREKDFVFMRRGGLTCATVFRMALELPPVHYLWLGLFIGVMVGAFGWWWLKLGVGLISGIVVAAEYHLFSANRTSGVHIHASGEFWLTVIVAVLALIVGMSYGRLRGLRHLGQSELNTRWTNVKRVSRW